MPRGEHRWNDGRMVASTGYAKVRVGVGHPLADPNGYAYEHLVVWVAAGNQRPTDGILHHINGNKLDNRIENLSLLTREEHAAEHHRMVPDHVVRTIRERYAGGENGTALAAEFGVPVSRAYRYIRGETRVEAGGPIATGCLRGKHAAGRADRVVVAWGAHPFVVPQEPAFRALCQGVELWCLGTTKAGHPRHPLYLRGDTPLVRWPRG